MNDIEYLKEPVVRGLVEILMSEEGMVLPEALELLSSTKTFDSLMDEKTGLYRESPSYVYELVSEETSSQQK